MDNSFSYPVSKLFGNITVDLKKYPSAAIPESISNGLDNPIIIKDQGGIITDTAGISDYIKYDDQTRRFHVELSEAYCQFLWLLCDIAIRSIDYMIAVKECIKEGRNITDLINANLEILSGNVNVVKLLKSYQINVPTDKFIEQIERQNELLQNKDFTNQMISECIMLDMLTGKCTLNLTFFKEIEEQIKTKYGKVVNSAFVKGISFVLLHENAHLMFGHLDKKTYELQDEENADSSAFWTMYSDINNEEKFSVGVGLICLMFSFLFLNPTMTPGSIPYPREDKRIQNIYNLLSADNPKYSQITIHLFNLWAAINKVSDFPKINIEDSQGVNKIISFLDSKYTGNID